MRIHKRTILLLLLLLMGCEVRLPFDAKPTSTPTRFPTLSSSYEVATPTPTESPPAPPPSLTPTHDLASPTATRAGQPAPSATPTPTPTPGPLQLRDDLPALTLKDFPRPAGDNGLGIHFLATGYYDPAELDREIGRMQSLHLKWGLVLYGDENQLQLAAPKFKAAGITVVWRKTLRAYQRYLSWGRDVQVLQQLGVPPYLQLYNEPELPEEWDDRPIDLNLFMGNLLQAAKDVYNAGGYPGVQMLDTGLLGDFISQVNARHGEALFHRMFFIPHAYGLNHPPDFTEDTNGVLGFRSLAEVFSTRLGFVPPFIIGEGGWKVGSGDDSRYPAIDEALHRDYTLAVFNWFRTGKLSNSDPLPDYLFSFCPWMISGKLEAGAWYDSFNGDRTLTIEAVQQMPSFGRKFSWGK